MFARTDAINKLAALKKRIKVVQGGTWGGKTYGIIPLLSNTATQKKNELTTIAAESVPALKGGAIRIFKSVMQETGRWWAPRWNGQDLTYTFHTGSVIQFASFQDVGKAKASGKRDRLFVNEGNHIPFDVVDALMMRTDKEVWIDYNPDEQFWAHTELLGRPDVDFIVLTYKDNNQVPESILLELDIKMKKAFKDPFGDWDAKDNIISDYWANWCRVYIKGEVGSLEGVIFKNWEIIPEVPADAALLGRGLDFGYSNDPTAIPAIYNYNGYRILDEECYQKGLVNSDIAAKLSNEVTIYADSAEPKSIEEIKQCGIWNIQATKKGADSINYGIQLMQGQKYLVTARSLNGIKELRSYCWDKDKSGISLNKPTGTDHFIDATRYHEMMTLSTPEPWESIV